MTNSEFAFEIKKHIGVIAEYPTGWKKEMNIVSWNGGFPKIDIRDWNPTHDHMSRGVTLSETEFVTIGKLARERAPEIFENANKVKENFEMER